MAVKGVFTSDSHIVGDKKGDFASGLLLVHPQGSAPLYALTSGMETADASDTIVTWFEENYNPGRYNQTNSAGTGTTLIFDNTDFMIVGMIAMSEASGEYIIVEAIAGTSVTVTRGFAGTTAVSSDGSSTPKVWQRIGTAFEEASDRPTAVTQLGFPRFNYTQIFRNSWNVSGTAKNVEFYTGDKVAKSKADCAMYHSEDIERSLWFGRRNVGIKNGKPFRTMDGIIPQITTNIAAQPGGGMTQDALDTFLQSVFERNIKGKPNERITFCGNTVVRIINKLAQSKGVIELMPGQTSFGMKVMKWMTPFGDISLMTHPLFQDSPLWSQTLYVLHPGAIRKRYLRRTQSDDYDSNGSRNGVDADAGVLTTELTVEYRAERTGGFMTGINAVSSTP